MLARLAQMGFFWPAVFTSHHFLLLLQSSWCHLAQMGFQQVGHGHDPARQHLQQGPLPHGEAPGGGALPHYVARHVQHATPRRPGLPPPVQKIRYSSVPSQCTHQRPVHWFFVTPPPHPPAPLPHHLPHPNCAVHIAKSCMASVEEWLRREVVHISMRKD